MGNCLITKLKGKVDAELPILGEFKNVFFDVISQKLALKATAITPNSVKCKIVSNNATFGAVIGDAVKISDTEIYLGTDEYAYFNIGESLSLTIEVKFENYYNIRALIINSPSFSADSSEFKFFNSLYNLRFENVTMTGNIGDFALNSISEFTYESNMNSYVYLDGLEKFNNTPLKKLSLRSFRTSYGILDLTLLNQNKRSDILNLDIQSTMNNVTVLANYASLFPNLIRLNVADLMMYDGQHIENVIRAFVAGGRISGSMSLYAVRSGILFNGTSIDGDGTESSIVWQPSTTQGYTKVTWKDTTIDINN